MNLTLAHTSGAALNNLAPLKLRPSPSSAASVSTSVAMAASAAISALSSSDPVVPGAHAGLFHNCFDLARRPVSQLLRTRTQACFTTASNSHTGLFHNCFDLIYKSSDSDFVDSGVVDWNLEDL